MHDVARRAARARRASAIIGLVLLQHGKGADMGAAFGSGSSGSLFGAAGSANFLSRTTAVLAAVFFLTSLGLTYVSAHKRGPQGVMAAGRDGAAGADAGRHRRQRRPKPRRHRRHRPARQRRTQPRRRRRAKRRGRCRGTGSDCWRIMRERSPTW